MSLPAQKLYVGLIGPGLVGKEVLRQIHARFHGPQIQSPFSVSVVFVATSKRQATLAGPSAADPDGDDEGSLDLETDWKAVLNAEGPDAEAERKGLRDSVVGPTDLTAALERLLSMTTTKSAAARSRLKNPAVLVDCSASSFAPEHVYGQALAKGVSVVTPNKCFAAGPASIYEGAIAGAAAAAAAGGSEEGPGSFPSPPPSLPMYLGEATVGAGLPVLSTLRDLLATGDRVKRVEGVFSGSLSFIFNTLFSSDGGGENGEKSPPTLASVVRKARDLGYTEPDPRDDLAGVDVARKAVILARALSRSYSSGSQGEQKERKLIELSDVPVRSLVPPHLADRATVDAEAFLSGLEADDGGVGEEVERARRDGEVLRFVGVVTVDDGDAGAGGEKGGKNATVRAEVALRAFPRTHPYAGLSGADNVFSFVTERYPEAAPLVVRGPGAGAAVTAAGVFGDLLTVARAAGASV